MSKEERRRRFGSIRQRTSGRWQVRYRGPDGRMRPAPRTFEREKDAEAYLNKIEVQMAQGDWVDPARGKVRLEDYAAHWIDERPGLRPRTVTLYQWLLEKHIAPGLGGVPLGKLDTPLIREWRSKLLASGVSPTMTAKSYRLLRAVLTTAVKEDRIIPRNPCCIPGADKESPGERPILTLDQVIALAREVPARFRALVLVATFANLRYGEVMALQRVDIDVKAGTVRVRQAFNELRGQGMVVGPPKSRAGRRTVTVPAFVVKELKEHLRTYVPDKPTAFVFTGPKGATIRRGNFNKVTKWRAAVASIGAPNLHFHDLRHTGNTLAARTRVSTRDLMARMGHDSMNAALIYQHATREADQAIASGLDAMFGGGDEHHPAEDGTAG